MCRDSRLVGLDGLEPSTSRLSGARSSHLSYRPVFSHLAYLVRPIGGDEGNRTLDPLLAGQVLSQLSYTPIKVKSEKRIGSSLGLFTLGLMLLFIKIEA